MATKFVFLGTPRSRTNFDELECFVNQYGELFLQIDNDKESEFFKGFICLDKETAISLRNRIDELIKRSN